MTWITEDDGFVTIMCKKERDVYQQDKMTLYIAGPMTGIPQFNFPAFERAAAAFRRLGYGVVSPAELDNEETRQAALASPDGAPGSGATNGETWGDFLSRDVKIVADEVDGVVLLPGWEDSKGARLEAWIARHVGKPVFYAVPGVYVGISEPHDAICHCLELGTDAVGEVDLAELDDAELDHVYTVADLEVLFKLASDEAVDEYVVDGLAPVAEADDNGFEARFEAYDKYVSGEVRTVDPDTGGEKGSKLARYDLIPPAPLSALAQHYGKGAQKYEDRNWERGYAWSLSYAAMQRHLNAWWGGETYDEETGSNHLTAAAWHCLALLEFADTHPEKDDRP